MPQLSEDARAILEYVRSQNYPEGTYLLASDLQKIVGNDESRARSAMDELVSANLAIRSGNAIMI